MIYVRSISSILTNSFIGFNLYSKVISVSSVTLPSYLTSAVLSSDKLATSSFLNSNPLCNFTLVVTLVAITGRDRILAKFW